MTDLRELLERVERATGPDRELDADLWWVLQHRDAEGVFNTGALGMPKAHPATLPIPAGLGRAGVRSYAPAYTAKAAGPTRAEIYREAASTISRLTGERERLRYALETIEMSLVAGGSDLMWGRNHLISTARAALTPPSEGE